MARPLRIQYKGAWYHVMNRGANHQRIFITDRHRLIFFELLNEITSHYRVEVHGYCLMDNHYHLLLQTPLANLARGMRHLDGVYTQKFNYLEKRDGALFRGRYKAILVENEDYLLNISRYIHLNPVTALICNHPVEYKWSSYQHYLPSAINHPWLKIHVILEQAGGSQEYLDFMAHGIDEETIKFYSKKNISCIYGSTPFIENIKNEISVEKVEISPDLNNLIEPPTILEITTAVTKYFNVNDNQILIAHRGQLNMPRLIAIYLCRKIGLHTYKQISTYFKMRNPYSSRSAIRRMEEFLETKPRFKLHLERIIINMNKVQGQT